MRWASCVFAARTRSAGTTARPSTTGPHSPTTASTAPATWPRRHIVDGQAYYSIEGRIKDVINRGVEKIHAEEVEELILEHPGVLNAALVAMPDPILGERGCAYLIMEPGHEPLTVATLGAHLKQHGLATYKLPERVEVVEAFPLSNVGKVSKKALREDVQAKLSEETNV